MKRWSAEIGAAFIRNFRPGKEFCWIAEQGGERVGAVLLVRKSDEDGQLRLLHVEREARGFGVGSQARRRMRRRRQARSATAGWCCGPTTCWSMRGVSTSAPASSWPARSTTTVSARISSARIGSWCCRVAGSSLSGTRTLAHVNALTLNPVGTSAGSASSTLDLRHHRVGRPPMQERDHCVHALPRAGDQRRHRAVVLVADPTVEAEPARPRFASRRENRRPGRGR